MQVLVIHGDEGIRNRLIDLLTAWDHEVVTATSTSQGLTFLQEERFDLILSRWTAQEESTLLHLRHIRSDRPAYTYLALLVDEAEVGSVEVGLEAGADSFLLTPIDPNQLRACMGLIDRLVLLEQELHALQRKQARLALYDTLTGLMNHQAIKEQAEAELSRARRSGHSLSLALIDMNFTLPPGSEATALIEQALRLAGVSITQSIRPYDRAGRWMDRSFLLVLPDATLKQASTVAERVQEQVAAIGLLLSDGTWFKLEPSAGVVESQAQSTVEIHALLEEVQAALKEAQERGNASLYAAPPL